jgi:hypothetical protein
MRSTCRSLSCLFLAVLASSLYGTSASAQEVVVYAPAPRPVVYDEHQCGSRWFSPTRRCRPRRWGGPVLMLGADLGISAMNESGPLGFNNGIGGFTNPGPAWGLRIGIEVTRWFALEARYVGMYNSIQSTAAPAGSLGFTTTGGEGVARFTLPLPFVHPYIFGGIGYYNVALNGSADARKASVLFSSSQPGIPMGFGVDIPLTWHVSFGIEATYHFQLGESFSNTTTRGIDGGDLSTVNGVLRVRL